jgi:hypothetical protein
MENSIENKIPPFPLGIPNMIVSEFMRMDCYENKDWFYPTPRSVAYMSGERKNEVYKAMKEAYYEDEVFRRWFLKNEPKVRNKVGNLKD